MRLAVFATAVMVFLCVTALAQTSPHNLNLEIEGISPTDYGYEVKIKITNTGTLPVVLMLNAATKPRLQSLDVQQWDGKAEWQSVGPCLDVDTDQTTTLKPGESLEDVVPIGDTSHGWTSSICPRTITHLGGKIRPVVYCSFDSERQFRNRMNGKNACKRVEGPSFALPTKDN